MNKKKKNFMDYVPVCNPAYGWDADANGIVTIHVKNQGFYNWLAQKLFHKPPVSHISLDAYGSFVWQNMDGIRNIYEISKLVSAHFGRDAEPVTDRLVTFVRILYQNKLIGYVKRNER